MLTQAELDAILFPPITGWLLFAKIFFILVSALIVAFIIYVWFTTTWLKRLILWDLKEFFTFRAYQLRKVDKDWMKILNRLETNLETEYKLSVIEADLLLDDVLKRMGYEGKNLSDRLERIKQGVFSDIQSVKNADQVYQNLIYDPSYRLTQEHARRIISVFEKALEEVQAFS